MARHVAIDLSLHLSALARHREEERKAKQYRPDFGLFPNLISLDGGAPPPSYFPFETISAQYLRPTAFPVDPSGPPPTASVFSWLARMFSSKPATGGFTIERYSGDPTEEFDIANVLSYSPPDGLKPIAKFVHSFARNIYKPGFTDWETLIDLGSWDALSKVLDVVSEPGDGCFVDEWSYGQSLVNLRSVAVKPVPVKMDSGGLDPVDLEHILANWDVQTRGCHRPRLLLQVPVGQNPTGITLTFERKKDIYDICVKWDIIIIEDDPYYFLQAGSYVAPDSRATVYGAEATDKDWVDSLVPSFLRCDYQGRVIRLDTFSKIIGPGGRLGFFTTSKFFVHHLLNAQRERSYSPSGLSQALYGNLFLQWGHDGFIRWLRGVRGLYRMRRDWALDLLFENFDVREVTEDGRQAFVAFAKSRKVEPRGEKGIETLSEKPKSLPKPLVRFVPPAAGMFLWFQYDMAQHPDFAIMTGRTSLHEARNALSQKLFDALLEAELLLRPGFLFQGYSDAERDATGDTYSYMRLAFAAIEYEKLNIAVERFAQVLERFFYGSSHTIGQS